MKNASAMTNWLSRFHVWFMAKRCAFTMAEILISLTIIGIIAAITLPSLVGNINERAWNSQRKALYARMSQAISLMPALNGFGTYIEEEGSSGGSDYVPGKDDAAVAFVTNGLSKVIKINNICSSKFEDCGISPQITNLAQNQINVPTDLYGLSDWFEETVHSSSFSGYSYETDNFAAVAFETQNGESMVAYYNRACRTDFIGEESSSVEGGVVGFPAANMCVNFIYDLNGSKGPNTVGKDIGVITVFNSMDSTVVAPIFAANGSANADWGGAISACTKQDSDTRIPNIEELSSLMINKKLYNFNIQSTTTFWSSTTTQAGTAWVVQGNYGSRYMKLKSSEISYVCIRRL